MKTHSACIAAFALYFLAAPALPAENDRQAEIADAQPDLRIGEELFLAHCAACHGANGKGNGPRAAETEPKPADLTGLSAQYDGEFPSVKVADVIRNGGRVLGHGDSDMPAWGREFAVRYHPDRARARIAALVAYVRSLQGH